MKYQLSSDFCTQSIHGNGKLQQITKKENIQVWSANVQTKIQRRYSEEQSLLQWRVEWSFCCKQATNVRWVHFKFSNDQRENGSAYSQSHIQLFLLKKGLQIFFQHEMDIWGRRSHLKIIVIVLLAIEILCAAFLCQWLFSQLCYLTKNQ